jgi:hypothetical protein
VTIRECRVVFHHLDRAVASGGKRMQLNSIGKGPHGRKHPNTAFRVAAGMFKPDSPTGTCNDGCLHCCIPSDKIDFNGLYQRNGCAKTGKLPLLVMVGGKFSAPI